VGVGVAPIGEEDGEMTGEVAGEVSGDCIGCEEDREVLALDGGRPRPRRAGRPTLRILFSGIKLPMYWNRKI
jgi:hypothetical protein